MDTSAQSERSAYFQALKAVGYEFTKHYRDYSVDELKQIYSDVAVAGEIPQAQPPAPPQMQETIIPPRDQKQRAAPPVAAKDPNELAGQRLNTQDPDEPIRTDEDGRVWYQEEVQKPAYPKPRGRRVLKYSDPGVVTRTVTNGEYTESFEVAGDPANAVPAEVKITLPSYQVGIYKDPRFPFKVVCYNGNEGFELFEVQEYYGGAELVPQECKRIYVENVLCYDIRSVVRAINTEYRQQQLAGHIQ
jgi:hypothetical protein